jgi:hypothetical protein
MSHQSSKPLTHCQIIIATITKAQSHSTRRELSAGKTEITTERFPGKMTFSNKPAHIPPAAVHRADPCSKLHRIPPALVLPSSCWDDGDLQLPSADRPLHQFRGFGRSAALVVAAQTKRRTSDDRKSIRRPVRWNLRMIALQNMGRSHGSIVALRRQEPGNSAERVHFSQGRASERRATSAPSTWCPSAVIKDPKLSMPSVTFRIVQMTTALA